MNETIRVFVAVKVSDDVADGLINLQSKLKKQLSGAAVRWSSREQLHITLAFLGDVATDRVAELTSAVGSACKGASPMELSLTEVGAFPSKDRPRVIWVGVGSDVARLCKLQERVAAATRGFGDHTEEREFHPHITLGRLARRSAGDEVATAKAIRSVLADSIGGWRAAAVFLVKSELRPSGAVYTDLAEFPLVDSA